MDEGKKIKQEQLQEFKKYLDEHKNLIPIKEKIQDWKNQGYNVKELEKIITEYEENELERIIIKTNNKQVIIKEPSVSDNIPKKKALKTKTEKTSTYKYRNILIGFIAIIIIVISIILVINFLAKTTEHQKIPDLAFIKQNNPPGITLVRADADIDWSELTVTGASPPSGNVQAGTFIGLDTTGGNNIITITYTATNTIIGTWIW